METFSWQYQLRGFMGLVGAFIIHLIIGASNRWNMLNIYATSYYKIMDDPKLNITINVFGTPLALFFMGFGMRVGIKFNEIIGTLYCCIVAILIASTALFISSFMPNFERTFPSTKFICFLPLFSIPLYQTSLFTAL